MLNFFRKHKKQPANAGQQILRSLGFDDETLALIPDKAYPRLDSLMGTQSFFEGPKHCLPCPYKRPSSTAPYGPYGAQKG